jgi:AcrR family transcriptional regulator
VDSVSAGGGNCGKRDRLLEAMVEAATQLGYGGVSVATVIERARVARSTFYEQFGDKEECFGEALERVAERLESAVVAVLAGGRAEGATEACLGALVGFAEKETREAKLLFLESLGAGRDSLDRRERLGDRLATLLEEAREEGPAAESDLEARTLIGGVLRLLAMRLRAGERGVDAELTSELARWARCYATTAADRSRGGEKTELSESSETAGEGRRLPLPVPLPRGRHRLSGAEVARSQRERVLAASARLSYEKGYGAVSVEEIGAAARVSRGAFYALFRDKRQAAAEANELFFGQVMGACATAYFAASGWPERVWRTGSTLVELIGAHPERAHLAFVECHAIGAGATRHAYDRLAAFGLFLEEGYHCRAENERIPKLFSEVISAATFELTYRELREHRNTGPAEEILPQRVYMALAPFIGPAAATEFALEKRRQECARASKRPAGSGPRRAPAERAGK